MPKRAGSVGRQPPSAAAAGRGIRPEVNHRAAEPRRAPARGHGGRRGRGRPSPSVPRGSAPSHKGLGELQLGLGSAPCEVARGSWALFSRLPCPCLVPSAAWLRWDPAGPRVPLPQPAGDTSGSPGLCCCSAGRSCTLCLALCPPRRASASESEGCALSPRHICPCPLGALPDLPGQHRGSFPHPDRRAPSQRARQAPRSNPQEHLAVPRSISLWQIPRPRLRGRCPFVFQTAVFAL